MTYVRTLKNGQLNSFYAVFLIQLLMREVFIFYR
jgi:hypothetical protein